MQNRSFHYGWVVVGITFLVLLTGAGIRATPSVLIVPLEQEFGWSAATIGGAVAINILLYGLIGPFAVAVIERFGLRRTVCGALLLLTIGVAATALMQSVWQLYLLWGFVVGSGTGVVALVLGAMVANRWFVKRRGLVIGLLTASSATGQLVFLPLLASLSDHFGWRSVSITVALVSLRSSRWWLFFCATAPRTWGFPPMARPPSRRASCICKIQPSARFWRCVMAPRLGTSGCWRDRSSSVGLRPMV